MGFLIALLTFVLVLVCIVLIFLVLLQLPKKDAGAGLAFGGAATDALFGAGSGNVLTKITKWFATAFFGLSILLAIMQTHATRSGSSAFERRLEGPAQPLPTAAATPSTPAPAAKPAAALTSTNLLSTPAEDTKLPPAPSTNAAPAAPRK